MILFGQNLILPTTTLQEADKSFLAKLLETNTGHPTDNFSLTDVVKDKATEFFEESILSKVDADNDTIKNRDGVEDSELPDSDPEGG